MGKPMCWLVCLGLSAVCGMEPGSAGLSGRVTDPSGAVVPGVVVRVTNLATKTRIAVTSGRDGVFSAANLLAGEYDVEVDAAGFAPFSAKQIAVQTNQPAKIDVKLRISAMSEQVTVTAKAPSAEGSLETSTRNTSEMLEIREVRESAARDVGEAISVLDGVWKIRKGGIANDVVLRGFQQGNINVLLDGQRIYSACPNHMDPAAFHVDFAEIETVEVLKGPYDTRNQGSLGGTVNVVTKRPALGLRITPNLSVGSFGFFNPSLTASVMKGRWYGLAGYSYRRSDPFTDGAGRRVTAYTNYTAAGAGNPAFEAQTGWGRFGADFGRSQSLDVSYTRQDGGLTLYPGLAMDAPYDRADRLSANWNWRELAGAVKQVRAQGYYSKVKHWMTDELRTGAVGIPRGYSMGTFAGTRAVGGRLEGETTNAVFGVESYVRGWTAAGGPLTGMFTAPQAILPDVRMVVGGAYGQYSRSIGRLSVTLGGRLDVADSQVMKQDASTDVYWAYQGTRSTAARDVNPSANARVTYLLPRGMELFAGAGSAVRIPDPEERYYSIRRMGSDWVGNPDLLPTRNNEVDFGVNIRAKRLTLRPTVFHSRLSNYVLLTKQPKVNSVPGLMNPAARSYEGVEASLTGGEMAYSIGITRQLLLSGGVAYVRGRQYAKPEAGLAAGYLVEQPPLKSRSSLRYGHRIFFAEAVVLASARQDRVDTRIAELPTPGYAVFGIKGGVHLKQWNLAAGVDNLTDRYYYEHLSFQRDPFRNGVRVPEPGRTLYLNLSYRFGE
ncbi:MAG: TonB-dependent receptor [Bryobacterales bacterium]|nr:TonB-dependent receptor [Bryobacterales bacterium]